MNIEIVKDLYRTETLVGSVSNKSHVFDRINRKDELRSRRKLDLLDSFASIINGKNTCTACFLCDGDNKLYISMNEKENINVTLKFAQIILNDMRQITSAKSEEEFILNSKGRNDVLTKILVYNISIINHWLSKCRVKSSLEKIGNEKLKKLFNNSNKVSESNVFEIVSLADEICRNNKANNIKLSDASNKLLRILSCIKWDYKRLTTCMLRYNLLGITLFKNITGIKVITTDPIKLPKQNYTASSDFIENKIDIITIKDKDRLKKICEFMNIKYQNDYDEVDNLESENQTSSFNGCLHAELNLMISLMDKGIAFSGCIGASKLCCSLCHFFTLLMSYHNIADFTMSGTHAKTYYQWAFPSVKSEWADKFNQLADDLSNILFISYLNSKSNDSKPEPDNDTNSSVHGGDDLGRLNEL